MRWLSQFTFITYFGNIKGQSGVNYLLDTGLRNKRDLHILLSKVNDQDSFDDFFKEENYRNLPPEEQLKRLNEDKRLYNNLQRLVKRSREYELPSNEVVSETVYPPPDTTTSTTDSNNGNNNDTASNNATTTTSTSSDEDVLNELYDKNYEPVKTGFNSNTTLELITSIIQQPVKAKCGSDDKVKSNFNLKSESQFKIMDYSKVNDEPLHENEIYLDSINKSLLKKNKKPITLPINTSANSSTGCNTNSPVTNNDGDELVEKKSRWDLFEELNRDKRFVRELRRLKLKKAIRYRRLLRHLRHIRTQNQNSYYHQLQVNEKGYRVFSKEDVDKFSYEEMQEELRNRGYRCSYDKDTLKYMLIDALEEDDEWRYEHIVKQELSPDNLNLSQESRNKLKELHEMINVMNETGDSDDISIRVKRLQIIFDLIDFYTDPVGYLDLDREVDRLDSTEVERLKNAPVLYDTTFIKEMSKPITRLPDLIPKTFNLQEDYVQKFPITTLRSDRELEDLKREYLTISGGIHQQTLPEISERFEVPLDFLGDSCCRLGAFAPIDLNRELRGIISYSAIWDLLQFLNICDAAEIELFYSHLNLTQISELLEVEMADIYGALDELGVKAHFGDETRLNLTCLQALEHYLKHNKES